ncbi:MAG: hypothetical protein JWL79_2779 [Frankiales bacterium]|nr:hypothetical protein [Frankiales bacterium]
MRSRAGLLVGLALAVLLLAPLLGPGYVLVRDMVFVPRVPIGRQLLGIEGVPRGVPSELVVALLGRVVATGWLQDLLLVALVVGAAWGAARLAPTRSITAACAAATTYGWSAYLHERLLLGQWAILVGWAVLPWAVRAALDWRRGAAGWGALAALTASALAGANALLLVGLAVVICGRPLRALAATAVLGLPWVVPAVLQHQTPGDPAGVGAFAANSDTPFGVVGSLLTGGGVWARSAVPDGRSAGSWIALALLGVAAAGLPRVRRRLGDRLLVTAAAGLVLALLGSLPFTESALRWAVVHVPAAGLLRDGQKWISPVVLLTSAAIACSTEALLARVAALSARRVLAGILVLAPVAALPGAAWGEGARLTSSTYPPSWQRVTERASGPVLVLPWSLYRAFPWDDGVTVLDPATKLLERPVVNDALPLPGTAVRGEDPVAARLDPIVRSGAPLLPALQREGIGEVLVERTTAGFDAAMVARQTQGLRVLSATSELALYEVPGAATRRTAVRAWPAALADLLALGFGLLAVGRAVGRRGSYPPE